MRFVFIVFVCVCVCVCVREWIPFPPESGNISTMGNEQTGGMGPVPTNGEKYAVDKKNTGGSAGAGTAGTASGAKKPAVSPRVKSAAAAAAAKRLSQSEKSSQSRAGTSATAARLCQDLRGVSFTAKELDIARGRNYHKVNVGQRNIFEVDVRYQNLKNIASGAYGTVCSADDVVIGDSVAIKKVADVFEDLVDAKRILREVKLLRHLSNHHNIIQLRDVMTSPPGSADFNDLYLVFDRYECDLDRLISMGQELSDAHNKYFLYQMLKGLKFIHSAGVMHRDLKPANILINSNCDLVICDFGTCSECPLAGVLACFNLLTRAPATLCVVPVQVWPEERWTPIKQNTL